MNEPIAWMHTNSGQIFKTEKPNEFDLHLFTPLYTHPMRELSDEEIIDELKKEINILKKRIYSLSVSREPKIEDRVILLDDESEGVIERLSIAGGARISFDDGCYGNYTKVELITLFAYKESE